jgi:hypothetical protein
MRNDIRCKRCDTWVKELPNDNRPPFTEENKPIWFGNNDDPNQDYQWVDECDNCKDYQGIEGFSLSMIDKSQWVKK